MRLTWRRLLVILASVVLLGLLIAWSGIINIGASSGHWRVTAWALHWAMQNSVRTYALFEPDPPADLDSAANIRRAAGHYETACAFCHGSPLAPAPVLAAHMTPAPPRLEGAPAKWTPRQFARIVRHGVKYTGMPSWIAPQRDDEVWSMVAFLRALPKMSGEDYRRLAFGPPVPEDPALERCARCHGVDGSSSGGAFPILAGQSEAYLVRTLRAYAQGTRPSGVMQFAVDDVPEIELQRLARYYAGLPGLSDGSLPEDTPGARIAFYGLPDRDVPACESCHGRSARRNPAYPRLAGQDASYLAARLTRMKKDEPLNARAHVMHTIAARLPEEAIPAVAGFYAQRGAGPVAPSAAP
ncbi:cytochrome c553 [Ancylobacter sp. 3268]|uniref:c-type cytochrome n=1 Tax=Ancylobacter sp. 3268 TaxID=2817752 RepID=UPI0028584FC5|nr:c-type cytochrome [Ancylobacter sp. 3268]MDR6955555.1 cytochrome c553 [Ancylobacter sp. 3268]